MSQQPVKILTDSACDIPFDLAEKLNIDILNFNIAIDGTSYTERDDFSFDEYYDILRECKGIPSTSHITVPRFLEAFEAYDNAGTQQLIYISINAAGSATHDAAMMAKSEFRSSRPASNMKIEIIDSHTYSMAYGWFVVEAARKLNAGEDFYSVAAWLRTSFSQVEIVLAAFSLKFMKKSGRISAAAAIAGEMLGIRPIISMVDGVSEVQKKVRGDKDVLPTMLEYANAHRMEDSAYLVGGTNQETINSLAELCEQKFGQKPEMCFKLGAAVSSNTGPDAVAIVYIGPKRAR